jgi:hypothetical protein
MAVCVGHGGPAGGGDGQFQGKPLIDDPMESIVEAQVSMLEWHMQSRKFGMTAVQLELLQQKSIEVLESFKSTLPGVSLKKTVLPMAGNSKRPIAFYTRCVSWFSLAGQRISAPKAQSTVASTSSRRLPIVPTREMPDTFEQMASMLKLISETLAREKAELEILKADVQYQQEQLELERKNRALERREAHKPDITAGYIPKKQQKKACHEKQTKDPRLWDWKCCWFIHHRPQPYIPFMFWYIPVI